MTTTELWRSVPGEPLLEASSLGRIRSVPYATPMPYGGVKINQLNPTYGFVTKSSKTSNHLKRGIIFRRKNYSPAILVCTAFHGIRPDGAVVIHKDEDAFNNREDNLKWGTQKENLNMPIIKAYHSSVCRKKFAACSTKLQ